MRKLMTTVSAAALATAMLSAPVAMAATAPQPMTDSGVIQTIDAAHKKLTLADGRIFTLESSVQAAGLTVGEHVRVTYTVAGSTNTASAVTMVQ